MQLEQELENYYNRSDNYTALMQEHGEEYFASYVKLVSRYAGDATNLLDIGCSAGASTRAIAGRFPTMQCLGIDLSRKAIESARKNHQLPNLRFEVGNGKGLPFPDHSFSIVTSCDCLEHIPNPETALEEMMRVVKPRGYLIVKGPNHMSPLYTLIDLLCFRHRYPFTRSWSANFSRLAFELGHLARGLKGKVDFVPRVPDLSDNVQVGHDADAVTDMCNLDVYNFFRATGWKVLNISWSRGNGVSGFWISRFLPLLGSLGMVAQKPTDDNEHKALLR